MSVAVARYEVKTHTETEVIELDIMRERGMIIGMFADFDDVVILCPPNDGFNMFRVVSNVIRNQYYQCGCRGVSVRFLGVTQDQDWLAE